LKFASKGCEIAIKTGDYVTAIDLLSKAIEINGTDFRFYANRSFAFYQIKQYNYALIDAEKAIKLNKNNAICFIRKASALIALNRFDEAEESAKYAIQLDQYSFTARYCWKHDFQ
jgi:serine/threonine-protein phosphatase 5